MSPIPQQLNSPESQIQFTLVWKVGQVLPASFETLLYSGKSPPAQTQAAYRVIVAHPNSRSSTESRTPYTERETLSYKLTVELRNLSEETASTDVVSLLKRELRGFVPIVGPLLTPLRVTGSDFGQHSQADGTWIWTINTSIELRRSNGENFELLPEVAEAIAAAGLNATGAVLYPLPEGFALESVGFGVYRSPAPRVETDESTLDRELSVILDPDE